MERDLIVWLAAALALALGSGWTALRLRRVWHGRRIARRRRRGAVGQARAADLLRRLGFRVLEQEHELAGQVAVDGELVSYTVRIDYLVQRDGRRYGVEVKTGERAPDPLHRPTRRQLLEYRLLLPDHGLLMLDMERGALCEIDFPGLGRGEVPRASSLVRLALALLMLGLGAVGLVWAWPG